MEKPIKPIQNLDETENNIDNSLQNYLCEIDRYPYLTIEEEKYLGIRILEGDQDAIQELVKHNLKLVVLIAKEYILKYPLLSFLDIIGEGNIGLYKAATLFDVNSGKSFSTYATLEIKSSIENALQEESALMGNPSYYKETQGKREYATIESLNRIIDDAGHEMGELIESDMVSPEDLAIQKKWVEEIRGLLDYLPYREAEIIKMRYEVDNVEFKTLPQIAPIFNVTQERIRQIEKSALQKLRKVALRHKFVEPTKWVEEDPISYFEICHFFEEYDFKTFATQNEDLYNQLSIEVRLLLEKFFEKPILFGFSKEEMEFCEDEVNWILLRYKDSSKVEDPLYQKMPFSFYTWTKLEILRILRNPKFPFSQQTREILQSFYQIPSQNLLNVAEKKQITKILTPSYKKEIYRRK